MALVNNFIFLDDAQYSKNSWHNRNRIMVSDGQVVWITIPIIKEALSTPINKIRIDESSFWREKHVQTMFHSYGRHPHYSDLVEILDLIENGKQELLADLNIEILRYSALRCGINSKIERASSLPVSGKRTERLENFCHYYKCDTYISTPGAREYLESDNFGRNAGLKLDFMNIEFSPYEQKGRSSFIPQLSIVDALANIGWGGVANLIGTK